MEKEPNASDREEKRCRLRNVWESLKDICAICVADKLVLKEKTDDEQSLISIKVSQLRISIPNLCSGYVIEWNCGK